MGSCLWILCNDLCMLPFVCVKYWRCPGQEWASWYVINEQIRIEPLRSREVFGLQRFFIASRGVAKNVTFFMGDFAT